MVGVKDSVYLFHPHASFDMKLGINSPYDLFRDNYSQYNYTGPQNGFKPTAKVGIGVFFSQDGYAGVYPEKGMSAGGSYTWLWDN